MADAANALNRLPPAGQPAQMQDGEFVSSAPRPKLFGQGYRELSGVPKIIVVPNPTVGHDWTYAFSGPSWYYFHFGMATLVTSAVVANRGVSLAVTYTGIKVGGFNAVITEPASQFFPYCFSPVANVASNGGVVCVPTPDWFLLKDGMTVGTATVALDVGDQWSAIALYVEEFTDKCLDYL